jgi:hypothetical protein
LGAGDLKKAMDAAQSPEQKGGESRSIVERRLQEPGMRRILKDPLYGPLASGADTSTSGKGCALSAKESRRRLPAEGGGGKEKMALSLKKPAPKINLVEAHLNRPSPQEKGQQLTTEQEKLKSFQGFLPNEGSGGARPRPPDDRGSRAGERFTLCIGPPLLPEAGPLISPSTHSAERISSIRA